VQPFLQQQIKARAAQKPLHQRSMRWTVLSWIIFAGICRADFKPLGPFLVLEYNTQTKHWQAAPFDMVTIERKDNTTNVSYPNGQHNLAKIYWPVPILPGQRILAEVGGVHSVELIDLEGSDRNAHAGPIPAKTPAFIEFRRFADHLEVEYNSTLQPVRYHGGPQGMEKNRADFHSRPLLYFSLTIRRGEQITFSHPEIGPIHGP